MPELKMPAVLKVLQEGEITIKGEFVWGSNYTFLAEVCQESDKVLSVYKPSRGERPLWDFPPASLARREAAAFVVSDALGWALVPPTVYRKKAPIGPGSLQLFIEHDPELHYFNLDKTDRQLLRPVVLFDLLINNADRKGSHLLFDEHHHLWLIDHGICFHAEDKLRTVIWDFAGEPIPEPLCSDIQALLFKLKPDQELYLKLQTLLSLKEIRALAFRAEHLLTLGEFPEPDPEQRSFPWPLV
ncbi:MAG TPA: SCO1664 family protein [Anaerolineales bacterium]|nr:SCO1664 family protein [Anaerolineales bacterium]